MFIVIRGKEGRSQRYDAVLSLSIAMCLCMGRWETSHYYCGW